jgi:hypothetical protein
MRIGNLTRIAAIGALLVCGRADAIRRTSVPYTPAATGALFPASGASVEVVVRDERPEKLVLSSGLGGFSVEKGAHMAFYAEKPEALSDHVAEAAGEALEILGLKRGPGGDVLTLTVRELRIDMFWFMMGAPNYVGYAVLDAVVTSPDGKETRRSFRIPSYDTSAKKAELQVAWVWSRATWQAVAQTLQAHRPAEPDPEALRKLCAGLRNDEEDDHLRAQRVFWLGLMPRPTPLLSETLLDLFRKERRQRVSQAAADALGILGVAEAREELLAVLTGKVKNEEWNIEDTQRVWHLVRPLELLGTPDVGTKIPVTKHLPVTIQRLRDFVEKGTLPEKSEKEKEKLQKALEKLAKKD